MNEIGKTWVLLRGLTREHRHWESFPEHLQHIFPDSQIITPDLPGNGDHVDIDSPGSIQEMLLFLRSDIAPVLEDGPVHIIGLSMGGMVAIEWMKSYPQECAAGILINTSLKGISPFYHRLRPKNYIRMLYSLFTSDIVAREKIIIAMTTNLYPDTRQLLRHWVAYAKANRVLPSNAVSQLKASSRYKAPEVKPAVPILLLNSEKDNLVNPQSSVVLARKWQLPIETHPSAGHDLTLDDSEWVCDKMRDWLSSINI